MELWLVSIPIEGHPLPKEESEYVQCGRVVFHQYNDPYPEYGKRFVASTIVEGKTDIVVSKAKEAIEDAVVLPRNEVLTATIGDNLFEKLNG
jgi:hypothetical protein